MQKCSLVVGQPWTRPIFPWQPVWVDWYCNKEDANIPTFVSSKLTRISSQRAQDCCSLWVSRTWVLWSPWILFCYKNSIHPMKTRPSLARICEEFCWDISFASKSGNRCWYHILFALVSHTGPQKIQKYHFLSIGPWEHPEWCGATHLDVRALKVPFSAKMTKMPLVNLGLIEG